MIALLLCKYMYMYATHLYNGGGRVANTVEESAFGDVSGLCEDSSCVVAIVLQRNSCALLLVALLIQFFQHSTKTIRNK